MRDSRRSVDTVVCLLSRHALTPSLHDRLVKPIKFSAMKNSASATISLERKMLSPVEVSVRHIFRRRQSDTNAIQRTPRNSLA